MKVDQVLAKEGENRIKKIASSLVKNDMDAVLLTWPITVYYVTGFPVGNLEFALYRPTVSVITSDGQQSLIVAKIHTQEVEETTWVKDVEYYPDDEFYGHTWINRVIGKLDGKTKNGIEKNYTPFDMAEAVKNSRPRIELKDCSDVIIQMRAVKSQYEVGAMREAAKVTEKCIQYAFDNVKEGMTELDVSRLMTKWKMEHDLDLGSGFIGLTSGAKTGSVGVTAGDKKIVKGDLINIDHGISVRNYNSDITRNAVLGKPSEKMLEIFNLVYKAQEAAREAVRPGVKASAVHAVPKSMIDKAGYGKYFFWNTGHGIGLAGHERPVIAGTDHTILEPGMTFTIEPGIKVPGLLGVHIEDDVVVTKDGYESLSTMTRELIRL
jgi:Xaa-Pro dipeptidase